MHVLVSLGFCKNIAEFYNLRLLLDNMPLFFGSDENRPVIKEN